ncbi:hypothetical protein D9M70_420880 [compost metagenome]
MLSRLGTRKFRATRRGPMYSFSAKPLPRSSMATIIASQNTTAVESALGREWMMSYSECWVSEIRPLSVFW